MTYQLRELSAQRYAKDVLPLTEPLWAHGRTLETYQTQTTELAHTPYGRASYRTIGLGDDRTVVASFKRYEREARVGSQTLRAVGIGAVFTPHPLRGQGFASAMLAMALDAARSAGVDFAYLFSDIHPQFYKHIGFVELASRLISFRADTLSANRIVVSAIGARDWSGVRSCFDAMEELRDFGLTRTMEVWGWHRARVAHASARADAQPVNLVARKGRTIAAYVIGQREPRHDAYVVDEIGFRGEASRELVAPLLRCAAGDLRRITGWLPPAPVRSALPRGSVRKRNDATLMIAPLSTAGTQFLNLALASGSADPMWSLDHI